MPGKDVQISPLPSQPVVKDLIPDLTLFYAQYASIEPWLHTVTPEPQTEWRQSHSDREKLDGLYECILCACCRRHAPTGGMGRNTSAPPPCCRPIAG